MFQPGSYCEAFPCIWCQLHPYTITRYKTEVSRDCSWSCCYTRFKFLLLTQEQETISICQSDPTFHSDPNSTTWDLMSLWAIDNQRHECCTSIGKVNVDDIVNQIEEFAEDIISRVKESQWIAQGMPTFLRRYHKLTASGKFHNAWLCSALHRFGWVYGGTVRSTQCGYLCRWRSQCSSSWP